MKVTIFDYGAGNLHSLAKAIRRSNVELVIETDPAASVATDLLVLPGVGGFGPAAARLAPGREAMRDAIQSGLPCLGICLGLHLLADASEEGAGQGLGIFPGQVRRLAAKRVPQIGWNNLEGIRDPVIESSRLEWAYFANSYVARPENPLDVVAWATYEGDRFAAALRRGATLALQFHPEKSSSPGLDLVSDFVEATKR